MKFKAAWAGLVVLAVLSGAGAEAATHKGVHPFGREVDLDATGPELHSLLLKQRRLRSRMHRLEVVSPNEARLNAILAAGKRLYGWAEVINAHRPAGSPQIGYSSEATQAAYPIDRPRLYNEAIVLQRDDDFRDIVPASIKAVLFDGANYPENVPAGMSDAEFIRWGHQYESIYQLTARWLGMREYLGELSEGVKYDVRGYVQLSRESDLGQVLSGWSNQPEADRKRLKPALLGICRNTEGLGATCETKFQAAEAAGTLAQFFSDYSSAAAALYKSYFQVEKSRTDVTWTQAAPELFSVPFGDPGLANIKSFLSDNIEDEFKWNGWQLRLAFQPLAENIPHMVFEAGTVPHVNEIAGNIITMDANEPLAEYNVRWTIRHEFGHVLGLPDCYVEFYDPEMALIVNYQLDTANLMCSRRGKMNQQMFDALKAAYFH